VAAPAPGRGDAEFQDARNPHASREAAVGADALWSLLACPRPGPEQTFSASQHKEGEPLRASRLWSHEVLRATVTSVAAVALIGLWTAGGRAGSRAASETSLCGVDGTGARSIVAPGRGLWVLLEGLWVLLEG
jgi:hypothetical protein